MNQSEKSLSAFIGPLQEQFYIEAAEKYDVAAEDTFVHEITPYYYLGNDEKYIATALRKARETIQDGRIDKTGAISEEFFRKEFSADIEKAENSRRDDDGILLIIVDALDFKKINKRFGHPGGDEVLRSIVSFLKTIARTNNGDKVGRLGGDEFAVELRFNKALITKEDFLEIIEKRLLDASVEDIPNFNGLRWNHAFHESGLRDADLYKLADVKGEENEKEGLVRSHDQTLEQNKISLEKRLAA